MKKYTKGDEKVLNCMFAILIAVGSVFLTGFSYFTLQAFIDDPKLVLYGSRIFTVVFAICALIGICCCLTRDVDLKEKYED